jgi:mRNA interferase MazF
MKISRGDVVVCAVSGDYGKPRPAVVVQADLYNGTHASMTLCLITSDLNDWPLFRINIDPIPASGLRAKSQVMIDKIMSVQREKIRQVIGSVSPKELDLVQRALKGWLGL